MTTYIYRLHRHNRMQRARCAIGEVGGDNVDAMDNKFGQKKNRINFDCRARTGGGANPQCIGSIYKSSNSNSIV